MTDPQPLGADERKVLAILMQPDRGPAALTLDAIAAAAGDTVDPVWRTLRNLEQRMPQYAHPQVDEGLGVTFWIATVAAADAVDDG